MAGFALMGNALDGLANLAGIAKVFVMNRLETSIQFIQKRDPGRDLQKT
jgi:hypothetical protein